MATCSQGHPGPAAAGMRRLLITLIAVIATSPAVPASMDGVPMADSIMIDSAVLRLNGMGLRTWTLPFVHVYVAGLYLERPSHNGNEILNSPQRKLLQIVFVRNVDAEDIRDAWRADFARYCSKSCAVPDSQIAGFLAAMPPMRNGDRANFAFGPRGVEVTLNGRQMGRIEDRNFAYMLLAVFIGPSPALPALKEGLLGDIR